MTQTYSAEEILRKNQKKGNPATGILALAVIAAIIGGSAYFAYPYFFKVSSTEPTSQPTTSPTPTPTENPYITLNETPVTEDGHFFEKLPVIEGQQAYIAYPLTYNKNYPPTLVIYSHGSNTTVTTNFKEDNMINMRAYGEFFTDNGYAFAASAQHGVNWGNQASVNDMNNLINWVKESYSINDKVNLLAHSMGGMPTLKFAMQNPEKTFRMALLAPSNSVETYKKADIEAITPVEIKIWHGDKDVNVPWSASNQLVAFAKKYGKEITFVTLKGKTHWDVDTELMPEILDFYNGTAETIE